MAGISSWSTRSEPPAEAWPASCSTVGDLLRGPGASVEEIADRTDGSQRGLRILLDALVALELVSKEGDLYSNRPEYEEDCSCAIELCHCGVTVNS